MNTLYATPYIYQNKFPTTYESICARKVEPLTRANADVYKKKKPYSEEYKPGSIVDITI